MDGGASMPLPTGVIRDSVDVLLAVDIRRRGVKPLGEKNIYEIMMRLNYRLKQWFVHQN